MNKIEIYLDDWPFEFLNKIAEKKFGGDISKAVRYLIVLRYFEGQ